MESKLTWLAYEALHSRIVISSILFLASTIYKKWKTFSAVFRYPDINTRGCWVNSREWVQFANHKKTVFCYVDIGCLYSGNVPEKKLQLSSLFMALIKREILTSREVLYLHEVLYV